MIRKDSMHLAGRGVLGGKKYLWNCGDDAPCIVYSKGYDIDHLVAG
jgi:hypothetical protein